MNLKTRIRTLLGTALLAGALFGSLPAAHAGTLPPPCFKTTCPASPSISAWLNTDWTITVQGSHFTPGNEAAVSFMDPGSGSGLQVWLLLAIAHPVVAANGTFTVVERPDACGYTILVQGRDVATHQSSNSVNLTYCPS